MRARESLPPTPADLTAWMRADVLARPVLLLYEGVSGASLSELPPYVVLWPLKPDGGVADCLGLVPCVFLRGSSAQGGELPGHAVILDGVPSAQEIKLAADHAREKLIAALAQPCPLEPPKLRFTVVIPTLERVSQAADAVRSLFQQSFDAALFEVIVVDNALDARPLREALGKALADVGKRGPQVRLLHMPVAGISLARNAGLAVARGEIYCSVDDDALARDNWLEALDDAWQAAPGAAAIGGSIVLRLPTPRPDAFHAGWEPLWSDLPLPYDGPLVQAADWRDYPWGANWSARRDALWRIGGFPVRYGRAGRLFRRGIGEREGNIAGEEVAAAAAIVASGASEQGRTVFLCPCATVDHHPAPQRFSIGHVRHTFVASALLEHRLYRDGLIASETPWTGTARQILGAAATMLLALLTARWHRARDRWLRLLALWQKLLVQLGLRADVHSGTHTS
jgi:hypothetical protein